jgi:predicted ATPase
VIHLAAARLVRPRGDPSGFPFSVPAIASLPDLVFDAEVTMLVGENGSGKSTLLEAIAIAARIPTAGSSEAGDDPTLAGVRRLAAALRLSWTARTHRGFYLRAEDFFGFAKRVSAMRADLAAGLAAVEDEYAGRPQLARDLARSPFLRELGEIDRRYGEGLDARSHGESFLRFFGARVVPGGLYLLDEPEAPLSPGRQLAFLSILREMVGNGCQVILATHSPIVLAFPGAAIWSFDESPIRRVPFESLEHVKLVRDFLAAPEAFLRHL